MFNSHALGMQDMQIVSLRFVETGTYNPMYMRPYETDLSNSTQQHLIEVTQGGTRVNTAALAGVAGQFLRPTANINVERDALGIVNGWDTRRLRFMAEIHYPRMAGGKLVQLVSGYTNHLGVGHSTFGSAMDPNMTLHFNSSILMQEVTEIDGFGNRVQRRQITNASQVLSAANYQHLGGIGSTNPIRLMRPEDIFSHQSGVDTYGSGNDAMQDLRQRFGPTRQMLKSRYQNGSPTHYLAASIIGHADAARQSDYTDPAGHLAGVASANVKEDTVSQDNFLAWLSQKQLLHSGSQVTWGELIAQAPGADAVAEVYVGGQAQAMQHSPTHVAGQSAYWHGAQMETVFANILAQSVPAALMNCMFTKTTFKATNRILDLSQRQIGGSAHNVGLGPTFGPVGEAQGQLAQQFISALQREILPDASMAGMIDYDIVVSVDIFGESRLDISLGGQPHVLFVVPSFSSSIATAVLAPNADHLRLVGSDINYMLGNICSAANTMAAPAVNPISGGYGF